MTKDEEGQKADEIGRQMVVALDAVATPDQMADWEISRDDALLGVRLQDSRDTVLIPGGGVKGVRHLPTEAEVRYSGGKWVLRLVAQGTVADYFLHDDLAYLVRDAAEQAERRAREHEAGDRREKRAKMLDEFPGFSVPGSEKGR